MEFEYVFKDESGPRVDPSLGHSVLSTTADVYTHVLPVLVADVAQRIGCGPGP